MACAKHIKIKHENFGDTIGEKTVEFTSHIKSNGSASWKYVTMTREEMLRLAAKLNVFALNDDNWR
jgi:hypothetical protein